MLKNKTSILSLVASLFYCVIICVNLTNVDAKKDSYKICVPQKFLQYCREMTEAPTKSKTELECVAARDRVECLSFVQQRQADFVPVDPEDMYIASKMVNQDFSVFMEYRTDDEPDAEFRYEAVIVVHKDSPVNSLAGLRGLKSCHTGVNRNVGYKIPLTMLLRLGILPPMNDRTISPKENELRALSTMFKQSCIVGKWSPDPQTTTNWKSKYSSLCQLCEHPELCDYPDIYSGYEGALRCLAHHGGEVAFTKVIFVRKFFGLPVGTIPAVSSPENPDEFAYLCLDGSKVPVREKPCSWAARPWQGLMGHQDVLASVTPLRQKMKQLADYGAQTNATWFTTVLALSSKIHHLADNIPIEPTEYLSKANYTAVIERGHGPPEPTVRLCVPTDLELRKCRTLGTFAFSRDIRPRLDCVLEKTQEDCLKTVRDNGADLAAVDGLRVASAASQFNLQPVFREVYGPSKKPSYAVAVVQKGGTYNDLSGLRGKRSCHGSFGSYEGYAAPLYALVKKQLIQVNLCPKLKSISEFFSGGSCMPGANDPSVNPRSDAPAAMTKHCIGKSSTNEHGDEPAVCLSQGRGEVAFMSSMDLNQLDETKYELLCLNKDAGGREPLSSYETCNIAVAPGRTWLAATDLISDVAVSHTPLSLAELLAEKQDLFNIFGTFLKNENVIFNSYATGLITTTKTDIKQFQLINSLLVQCGA